MKYPKTIIDECSGVEVPNELYKAYLEGVKEVVDSLDWESTAYQTIKGSPIIQLQVSEAEWEAKLKEWEIE